MQIDVDPSPIRVPGYRFAGVHCGLKSSGKRDIALMVSDTPAAAAGVFTRNRVKAAPVVIGRQRLRGGQVQAVLVNSGNANAYTGADGLAAARTMTGLAARRLGMRPGLVVPSSTGRIGVPLPREIVARGVHEACDALHTDGFHDALEGIMTTDAFPKFALERVPMGHREVTIAAMAKGAGMIAPDMATMLCYVFSDAAVAAPALRAVLRDAVATSFNTIVVDGDMSTNDTVLLLANGAAGHAPLTEASPELGPFADAVGRALYRLARMVVKDGEGATKVVDIVVRGARTRRDAERVADAIARSPLCKTAFYGGDPYAGRLVCAAGYSGARFDPGRIDIALEDVPVVRAGVECTGEVEARAAAVAARDEFTVTIDLHVGTATARRMASDLSTEYVVFNSAYRT